MDHFTFDELLSSYVKHVGRCTPEAFDRLSSAYLSHVGVGFAAHGAVVASARKCCGDTAAGSGRVVSGCVEGTGVSCLGASCCAGQRASSDAFCVCGLLAGSRASVCCCGANSSESEVPGSSSAGVDCPVAGQGSVVGSVTQESSVGQATSVVSPGRWAVSNRRKKLRRKQAAEKRERMKSDWRSPLAGGVAETGFPAFPSRSDCHAAECPPYDRALSDAEREARDTLAQRRAAENKVARKLAEMKLASLEDEKKCQEYADLKHQRVIQWTNEATAKSQQSLDKVKSIDPSSSASQYEIRQQAKELADTKATLRTMTAILKDLSPDFEADMEACRPCGTEEFAMYAAAGGYSQYSEEIENAPVR